MRRRWERSRIKAIPLLVIRNAGEKVKEHRMRKEIKERLQSIHLTWHYLWGMARHVQGVTKDRQGKRYWRYVNEYAPGHFRISLYAWPSLTFFSCVSAGWTSVGKNRGETSWMIYDVRVDKDQYKQRGIGTALVRAAIELAQRHKASQLQGFVSREDAEEYPFLPAWYTQLGFTVRPATGEEVVAVLCMDLSSEP